MELVDFDINCWPLPKLEPHLNIDDIFVPNFYLYIGITGASRTLTGFNLYRNMREIRINMLK
jgi:hypothetical protein